MALGPFRKKPKSVMAEARIPGLKPYPFKVHPDGTDEFISPRIRSSGEWEAFETGLLRRLLPFHGVFLDLGANIGWYTAMAQRVMRGGEIVAFEPDPTNFSLLKANTKHAPSGGPRTRLEPLAVSDKAGEARLYHSPVNLGDHRLNASEPGRASLSVAVTTLDDYFAGQALAPILAKLDTQGSEPAILRGAARVLSPTSRNGAIVMEFWPAVLQRAGEDLDRVIAMLTAFTPTPLLLHHDTHTLRPQTWERLAQRAKTDLQVMHSYYLDLLLLSPEAPAYASLADLISTGE